MKTIRQIWEGNGRSFPFAIRRNPWANNTYAVIIKFGPDSSALDYPVGIPLTNDRVNFRLKDFPYIFFIRYSVIPQYDKDIWELVTEVNLKRFEKVSVHSLNNVMYFGKYLAREVKDIVSKDREYLFWLINNINDFALSADVIDYIQRNYCEIDSKIIELNKQKLTWLQTKAPNDAVPAAMKSFSPW